MQRLPPRREEGFVGRLRKSALGDVFGQNLDGDGAVEPGVARFVHFSHTSSSDRGEDFVRTEFATCRKGHLSGTDQSSRSKSRLGNGERRYRRMGAGRLRLGLWSTSRLSIARPGTHYAARREKFLQDVRVLDPQPAIAKPFGDVPMRGLKV